MITLCRMAVRSAVCLIVSLAVADAVAQQRDVALPRTPESFGPYRLEIRVLMRGSATARVQARNWAELFQKIGHTATIATDNGGESLGVRSREGGRQTVVEVVGLVERNVLQLGKNKYRLSDTQALKQFLDHLEKYGSEGPIRQRPTWGLSEEQYTTVLRLLAPKVGREIELSSPVQVVEAFALLPEFRVTWTAESRKVALSQSPDPLTVDLRSLSTGTGLAVALSQFGLGFRVIENRRRGYDIEIDAGDESSNMWPAGWRNKRALAGVLPLMYRHVEVDLEDDFVVDIIDAVAERVEVPWFCSRHQVAASGIDFENIRYSAPPDRESPRRLLDSLAGKHKMGIDVRTDEAGQLFLWCTTAADQKAWKQRFARVIPKTGR